MDPPQSRHLATRWLFVLELLLNNRRRNNSTSNNVNDTTGDNHDHDTCKNGKYPPDMQVGVFEEIHNTIWDGLPFKLPQRAPLNQPGLQMVLRYLLAPRRVNGTGSMCLSPTKKEKAST